MSDELFYEDPREALRHVVATCGGLQAVGHQLYPHLSPDKAGQRLADSLNPTRRESLDLDRVVLLLRLGRQRGCHVAMHAVADAAGYERAMPVSPARERAMLEAEADQITGRLERILDRMQRLRDIDR